MIVNQSYSTYDLSKCDKCDTIPRKIESHIIICYWESKKKNLTKDSCPKREQQRDINKSEDKKVIDITTLIRRVAQ